MQGATPTKAEKIAKLVAFVAGIATIIGLAVALWQTQIQLKAADDEAIRGATDIALLADEAVRSATKVALLEAEAVRGVTVEAFLSEHRDLLATAAAAGSNSEAWQATIVALNGTVAASTLDLPTIPVTLSTPTDTQTPIATPTPPSPIPTSTPTPTITSTPTDTPAPTPSHTPTSPPTPSVTLPFQDAFEQSLRAEWEVITGEPIIQNGRLSAAVGPLTIELGDDSWGDYSVEFDFDLGGTSIIIEVGNKIRYYLTGASWWIGGEWRALQDNKWAGISNSGAVGGSGRVRLEVRGPVYTVFVNGNPHDSITFGSPAGGPLRLIIPKDGYIDNLTITSP